MKLIFCDLNKELKKKVKKVFEEEANNIHSELIVSNTDLLKTKKKYNNALIVTASNPMFTMGGGLDKVIKDKFGKQCENAREFKFTKDLFFTITCDENIKSTRKMIKRALLGVYFANRKNDIILTGLGTSIAGLSDDEFITELRLFLNADFRSANFRYTDFRYANFRYADFRSADFRYTDFRYADFSYADFSSADFRYTDFRSANFRYTDFRSANFRYADFENSLFNYRILSEEGKIIGWKKAKDSIVKLEIDCKTAVGGMVGRKCRCMKAKVLEIKDFEGNKLEEANSNYDSSFIYKVGKTVKVEDWNKKPYLECEKGIHFFITKQEAEYW